MLAAAFLAGRLAAGFTTRLLHRTTRFRASERFLVLLVVIAVNSGYVAVTNEVKARSWAALRNARMTFSADVTASVVVSSADQPASA